MYQVKRAKLAEASAFLFIGLLTLLFFWKILLTNLILVGVDTFLYFYPYKAYAAEALRQGRLPLWNPHLFMGAPLLANSQVGLFYPLNWPLIWLEAPKQVAWSIAIHIVLAGILMFLFIRHSLRLSWPASFVAAILFAFSGYLGAQVEHINQLNAAVWLPLLFLFYDFGIQREKLRRWFWFFLLAAVVALTLLAGHAQTVFIALFGLGLYALWRGLSETTHFYDDPLQVNKATHYALRTTYYALSKFNIRQIFQPQTLLQLARSIFTHLWPLAVASGIAAVIAAVQLIPTAELSALSIRSGGLTFREVVSFSLKPGTLHYTLLPPFGVDLSQVWGEAFSEWVAYLGVSGLGLVCLGALLAVRQPVARRFIMVAVSGFVLSLGLYSGPVYAGLYYLAPGFDLFRAPARWLLLYTFGAAVLAGLGFEALFYAVRLRDDLQLVWGWLYQKRQRLWLLVGTPCLVMLILIARRSPPLPTLLAWLILLLISLTLITYRLRSTGTLFSKVAPVVLILMLLGELFGAAQALNYNHPTAPQAYNSMRNAVAFLLAADPPANPSGAPPDRFLSLSGVAYDPGDLADLEQIYGQSLPAEAVYDLVVATKEKEVLFFNLPLLYGLHSVDGYDGGILPLSQFVTLQQLFLPAEDLSLDGRLREKLHFVPPGYLLSLLNTRWVITDKVFDAWIDGVFYDLQFPARLDPGQNIATKRIPAFPTTALGVVSHLNGAATLAGDTPAARVTLSLTDGQRQTFTLRTGLDTAEGAYPTDAAHPQATVGVPWPYGAAGVDYISVWPLTNQASIAEISVEALLPEGQFVLRGLSLIHQPTHTSRSVMLSTEGEYQQVHSGDVKIYENLAVLPRAYVVHQAQVVADEAVAIDLLKSGQVDPATRWLRLAQDNEPLGSISAGQPAPQDKTTITHYSGERVAVEVNLESPGWLILTDTYYPGWQATVDGQPVEIFRANLNFRAVAVPPGEHVIVFEYRPRSFQVGAWISGLALVALGAGLAKSGFVKIDP